MHAEENEAVVAAALTASPQWRLAPALPAWQQGQRAPLCSAPARLLRLLSVRLVALVSSVLPGERPAHRAPSHCLGCSSEQPPSPPISPPLTIQAWPRRGLPHVGLSEQDAAMCIRCCPRRDLCLGFFVACFERRGEEGV